MPTGIHVPSATASSPSPTNNDRRVLGDLTNQQQLSEGLDVLASAVERLDVLRTVSSSASGSTSNESEDCDEVYDIGPRNVDNSEAVGNDSDNSDDDDSDDDSLASTALKQSVGHFAELLLEGKVATEKAAAAAVAAAELDTDGIEHGLPTAQSILLTIVDGAIPLARQLDSAINNANASKGCSSLSIPKPSSTREHWQTRAKKRTDWGSSKSITK